MRREVKSPGKTDLLARDCEHRKRKRKKKYRRKKYSLFSLFVVFVGILRARGCVHIFLFYKKAGRRTTFSRFFANVARNARRRKKRKRENVVGNRVSARETRCNERTRKRKKK